MRIKISVMLVEKSFGCLDGHVCLTSIIHKIHYTALPLGDAILGGNENL